MSSVNAPPAVSSAQSAQRTLAPRARPSSAAGSETATSDCQRAIRAAPATSDATAASASSAAAPPAVRQARSAVEARGCSDVPSRRRGRGGASGDSGFDPGQKSGRAAASSAAVPCARACEEAE